MVTVALLLVAATATARASFLSTEARFDGDDIRRVPENAPEWCKNKTEMGWAQRKAKMDAAEAMKWVKKQVKALQADNQEVPTWMEHLVNTDAKRGALKWAVQEAGKLKVAGKEVPKWMLQIADNDAYYGRKWAACKAAELRDAGKEVPSWMQETEKKGLVEGAEEKIKKIDETLNNLELEKTKARAIIEAGGDMLRMKKASARKEKTNKVLQGNDDKQTKAKISALDTALSELADAKDASQRFTSKTEMDAKMAAVQEKLTHAAMAASRLATALQQETSAFERAAKDQPAAEPGPAQ